MRLKANISLSPSTDVVSSSYFSSFNTFDNKFVIVKRFLDKRNIESFCLAVITTVITNSSSTSSTTCETDDSLHSAIRVFCSFSNHSFDLHRFRSTRQRYRVKFHGKLHDVLPLVSKLFQMCILHLWIGRIHCTVDSIVEKCCSNTYGSSDFGQREFLIIIDFASFHLATKIDLNCCWIEILLHLCQAFFFLFKFSFFIVTGKRK